MSLSTTLYVTYLEHAGAVDECVSNSIERTTYFFCVCRGQMLNSRIAKDVA
jgi:hypothetical protein